VANLKGRDRKETDIERWGFGVFGFWLRLQKRREPPMLSLPIHAVGARLAQPSSKVRNCASLDRLFAFDLTSHLHSFWPAMHRIWPTRVETMIGRGRPAAVIRRLQNQGRFTPL